MMANLLAPDEEDKTQTTAPGESSDVSVSGGTSGATSPGGSALSNESSASQTSKQPAQTGNQADINQISSLNQGADFKPVSDYVSGQGTTARNAIGGEKSGFDTVFGDTPIFGDQQKSTLTDVLGGKQDIGVGQNLLNTKYTGPTGVDRTHYDPQVNQYVTTANQTADQGGLSSLLGGLYPSLTPGERNFDALSYGNNPLFQQASKGWISDAGDVQNLANTTAQNSYDAVAKRQNDIKAFDQAGNDWVQGQIGSINDAVTQRMNNVNARQGTLTDEINQLKSGAKNFSDFNAADFGFDPSKYGQQSFNATQQVVPAGNVPGGMEKLAGIAGLLGQFPSLPKGLSPTAYAQMAPNTFSQTVDPRQFLQYASSPMTRMQAMTADQANQYDRAQQLLYQNDYIDPSKVGGGGGGNIGFDQAAFQQALAQAQQGMSAANQKNTDWYNTQMNIQNLPIAPGGLGHWSTPTGGGIPVGPDGKPLTQEQIVATQQTPAYLQQQAMMDPRSNPALFAQMTAGRGYATGGEVQPDPNAVADPTAANLQLGGGVPTNVGIPGQDSVPAVVTPGEFVTNRHAAQAVGPQNMQALNTLNQKSPMQQAMIRQALQGALAKAAVTPDLTTAQVGAMPYRAHTGGTFGQSAVGQTDQTTQKQTQAIQQQRRKKG